MIGHVWFRVRIKIEQNNQEKIHQTVDRERPSRSIKET
jgi:hypothetical protein